MTLDGQWQPSWFRFGLQDTSQAVFDILDVIQCLKSEPTINMTMLFRKTVQETYSGKSLYHPSQIIHAVMKLTITLKHSL